MGGREHWTNNNCVKKKIDLHIHSSCSDGRLNPKGIFEEALKRNISILSITDHDSLACQREAKVLAGRYDIKYVHGLELSVTFPVPGSEGEKTISLDFLGYQYDINNIPLAEKLESLRQHRKRRAEEILKRINREFALENLREFDHSDLKELENSVEGAFGRPHIADYMVKRGIVKTRQDAFNKYLVKCDVPKMPLSLPEASTLVRGAGGMIILAHPNHPRGTSLIKLTEEIKEQQDIINEYMLPYIDGVECWHSEHDTKSTDSYLAYVNRMGMIATGGSDCHQQPLIMGTVDVPLSIADQFDFV